MRLEFNRLLPYAAVLKSWLINLSVASFAVGIYESKMLGIVCGSLLICFAWAIVYAELKTEK